MFVHDPNLFVTVRLLDNTPAETGAIPQKTQNKKSRGDDSRDSDDRLRNLPEWLEEFTDSLEDTEMPAPAHISQDSDSERPTKVVSKSRNHSIETHFPNDRNCEVCMRTKMTMDPCRSRYWRSSTSRRKFC